MPATFTRVHASRLLTTAERELGDKFDPRRFHDTILAPGSIPLPVLEEEIRAFIASEKRRQ